jgi:sugar (pentulose or hexulose) kinase
MTRSFLLGIDAGQTVTKAVLFDAAGHAVATARVDTTVASPRPGWYEPDMTLLRHDAAAAIRTCLRGADVPGRRIAAIGLCGHNDGVYAVGAAALAGIGIGWYATLEDAVAATVRVTRRHEPHPTAILRERFEWYGRLATLTPDGPR